MKAQRSATERLTRLRRLLTLAVGVLIAIGLALLATVVTVVDQGSRDQRFLATQQSLASRASALVYLDEQNGGWQIEGVVDDMVAVEAELILITDRSGAVLYQQGPNTDVLDFVNRGLADSAEQGVTGRLEIDGSLAGAAASPFFDGDQVAGAVVVGGTQQSDPDHDRLVLFVWTTAAAITALSLAGAWAIAGRVLQPMGESIDREGAFLATAAHELRTPLARAQAAAESTLLTARELPAGEGRTALVADVRRLVTVTRDASSDMNDLLLMGRIDSVQLEERREVVRLDQLVSSFEALIPELAVETSGPVEITADPALVRHALTNLFTNAQRHARAADRSLLIEAEVTQLAGAAHVRIRDNGPGLAATDPAKIFTRHYSNGGGTGLGLWIVDHVITRDGGSVTATDHTPNGVEFHLQWPS